MRKAEAKRSSNAFAWEHGYVSALATAALLNHDLQAVAYALKEAGLTIEKLKASGINKHDLALMHRALKQS